MTFGAGGASVRALKESLYAKGYSMGGDNSSSVEQNNIERLSYPSDTNTNLGITLATASARRAALFTSNNGYVAGGFDSGNNEMSEIDGLIFDTETKNNIAASLTTARRDCAGASGDKTDDIGIVAGGHNGTSFISSAEKLTWSTEAQATISGTLSASKGFFTGWSGTAGIGYWAGGNTGSIISAIDGIDFGTEASDHPSATLASGVRSNGLPFSSSTDGYVAGGWSAVTPTYQTGIDSFKYSNETAAAESASIGNHDRGGGFSSVTRGFTTGGTLSGTLTSALKEYSFADDTIATLSATLSAARRFPTGIQSWPQ